MEHPRAGTHYPRSTGELQAWFRTGADCLDYLDYLDWLRWPGGFACPSCGHAGGWRLASPRMDQHASVRYARPCPEAGARHVAATDPAARRCPPARVTSNARPG